MKRKRFRYNSFGYPRGVLPALFDAANIQMEVIEKIRTEWAVIRQAPLISLTAVAVLTGLGWAGIYWFFSADRTAKQSLIETLDGQLTALQRENDQLKKSPPVPALPIPAPSQPIASNVPPGDKSVKIGEKSSITNSAIVTGDKNNVSINDDWAMDESQRGQLKKELADLKAKIEITEILNNRHSHGMAEDVGSTLKSIQGLDVEWGNLAASTPYFGFKIVATKNSPQAVSLYTALRKLNAPVMLGVAEPDTPADLIRVYVGSPPNR